MAKQRIVAPLGSRTVQEICQRLLGEYDTFYDNTTMHHLVRAAGDSVGKWSAGHR
ncbi:MAG TPA: hypothetical protein VI136_02365 [Verrucomicrobiae bacterium]